MAEPIKVSFQWTMDELLKAQRWHWRQQIRPLFRALFWILVILPGIMCVGFILKELYADAALTAAIVFYFVAIFKIWRPWYLRRQFAKRPDRNTTMEWLIDADKIRAGSGLGHSELTWKLIIKVVQTPAGFLFYYQPQYFSWLPREGFTGEADVGRLSEMAKANAAKFRQVD